MHTTMDDVASHETLISQANQPYEAGQVILTCARPLVAMTKLEWRQCTCEQCFNQFSTGIVCPTCRKAYYCCEPCRTTAWETIHRLECAILCRHPPLQFETNGIDYMQRLTLRLYLLLSHHPELRSKQFTLHNGNTQTIEAMVTHQHELKVCHSLLVSQH